MNTETIDINKIKRPVIAYYNEMQKYVIAKIYYPNRDHYDSLNADWRVEEYGVKWWSATLSPNAKRRQKFFVIGLIGWQYI